MQADVATLCDLEDSIVATTTTTLRTWLLPVGGERLYV